MCPSTDIDKLLSNYAQSPTTFQDLLFQLWPKPLSSVHLNYRLVTGFLLLYLQFTMCSPYSSQNGLIKT